MPNHPNRSAGNPARNPTPAEVRAAREAAGLTQQEAGELIHGSRRAWQDYESGARKMHPGLWELFQASLPRRTPGRQRGMMAAQTTEEEMNASHTAPASPTNMKVAYHPGGLLFAGDERYFPAGWYLFDGEDARPVTVFEPFSNDQIVVGE